jgi:hypothetical protein
MRALSIFWGVLWAILATPFAYGVVLCALIGGGPTLAKQFADRVGVWFP